MPRPKSVVPALLLHRPTGQARVRIDGREIYLGPHGSPEAEERYRRVVAEHLASGGPNASTAAAAPSSVGISVNELLLAYWRHARAYYRKDGRPTSELQLVRDMLRLIRQHYGTTPVVEFGPLRLKALRAILVARGICRPSVNKRIGRVKRLFKWGVENEMVPPMVHHGLAAVVGLRKGRTEAVEPKPVSPVEEAAVNAVLPYLGRHVRAMVMLQFFTGMRPGEVCSLRPCDVDRGGEIWEYRPKSHKMEHTGRERVVYVGPRAQAVLGPWLENRPALSFCFSPAEARREWEAAKRATRKTRVQPSQMSRRKKSPKSSPGPRYTTQSYGHAIGKACRRAGVEPWSPNRLRHTCATAIRKSFGIEAAQVTLGHSDADVTQIYAERDAGLGRRVAAEIG